MPQFDTISFFNQIFTLIYTGVFFQWLIAYSLLITSKNLKFRNKLLKMSQKIPANKTSENTFATFIILTLKK
jgi:hypothetical protein